MKIIFVYNIGFLLRLAVANPSRPCGCRPVFDFCANDYHTYHSICEYKCKHPSTPFQDWYILYQGPCLDMSDLSDTQRSPSCGVNDKGYEWEPSTGSCYKYHPIIKSWRRARDICLHEGGQLAIINSVTESLVLKNIYLKNQIYRPPHMDPNHAFIGFRKSNDGKWVTVNGQSLAEAGFDRWAPGEPNNYKGMEECGSIRDGLLNDWPCSKHPLPCICEITP